MRSCQRVMLVVMVALGCGKGADPTPSTAPSPPTPPAAPAKKLSRAGEMIARVQGPDEKVARDAAYELEQMEPAWTADEGLEILAANLPERVRWANVLRNIARPDARFVAAIDARFESFESTAKVSALLLLSKIDDPGAARRFVALARQSQDLSDTWSLIEALLEKPHHAEIIVPLLFEFADGNSRTDVVPLLAHYCDQNRLPPAVIAPHVDTLLARYRADRKATKAMKPGDYDYQNYPSQLTAALELFRCLPVDAVRGELTASLGGNDHRVSVVAMSTLLDLAQPVPDAAIARLAAAPEARKAVFLDLTARDALARMPARYRTQPMLAEGEVAAAFDEILVPSKIVLAKVLHVDTTTSGMLDVYIFRLRLGATASIGVTGAYLRAETPTAKLYGKTYVTSESEPPQKLEDYAPPADTILATWKDEADDAPP